MLKQRYFSKVNEEQYFYSFGQMFDINMNEIAKHPFKTGEIKDATNDEESCVIKSSDTLNENLVQKNRRKQSATLENLRVLQFDNEESESYFAAYFGTQSCAIPPSRRRSMTFPLRTRKISEVRLDILDRLNLENACSSISNLNISFEESTTKEEAKTGE